MPYRATGLVRFALRADQIGAALLPLPLCRSVLLHK